MGFFRTTISTFLTIFLFVHTSAHAEQAEGGVLFGHNLELSQLSREVEFTVNVYDNVTDGCWLTASRTKASVERELLDAGYRNIVEETLFGANLAIEVLGYGTSEYQCVISISSHLYLTDSDHRSQENVEWVTLSSGIALSYGALLSGPKSTMTDRIQGTIEGHLDEMLVDIQQAKNQIYDAIESTETSDSAKAYLSSIVQ